MKNVRVGIIGIGNIGSAHLSAIARGKVDGMELGAICDIDEEVSVELGQLYEKYPFYTNYKELIDKEDVDAIIVSVPHRLHAEIAEYALLNRKHVLVEKPIDISVTKAKRLNDISLGTDKIFAVMFNQRTNEIFKKAREIVKGGQLGELKRSVWIITNWYRTQAYYDSGSWRATWAGEGGGVLLNQAPHNLDLWQWICGMPSSVMAYCDTARYHNIEVEDDVTIIARFPNGATGTFITSTGEYPGTNRLEISGDLGKMVLENGIIKLWRLKESEREYCFKTEYFDGNIEMEYEEFKFDSVGGNHLEILQNYADAIRKNIPLISPGIEGINEIEISNAAYLSQWEGNKQIDIPFDSNRFDELLCEKAVNSSFHKSQVNHRCGDYNKRWTVQW